MENQQKQTFEYFRAHADEWREKAKGAVPKVNVIMQRNAYVLAAARELGAPDFLDVGCGTGELVVEASRFCHSARGVDFAPEMIVKCEELARTASAPAQFQAVSVFEAQIATASVDLISANGFIEYISFSQLEQFIALCFTWLRPGGVLILGSRNRLYNLFSMNNYTQQEYAAGTHHALLAEAIAVSNGAAVAELANLALAPYPESGTRHERTTGIAVDVRHQYTPGQLAQLLRNGNFTANGLGGVHPQAVSPAFKGRKPEIHVAASDFLYQFADDPALLPFCSTFMIRARRN